jgi:hypothetical protein
VLLAIIGMRFPSLTGLAEAQAGEIERPDVLNILVVQISAATDEQAARRLLEQVEQRAEPI